MSGKALRLEPNPNYGKGVFRRHVKLRATEGGVIAELEDDCHAFRLIMEHDGNKITDLRPEFIRVPKSTCDGAGNPLAELIGTELFESALELARCANPRANCTHLFDLLSLAITHAYRGEAECFYDLTLADERGGLMAFEIHRNGERMLAGELEGGGQLLSPQSLEGGHLKQGFTSWARETLSHDVAEMAMLLQRSHMVSVTRRVRMELLNGVHAADDMMPRGVCYSYSEPAVQDCYTLPDTKRDFTDTPEQLLKFTVLD